MKPGCKLLRAPLGSPVNPLIEMRYEGLSTASHFVLHPPPLHFVVLFFFFYNISKVHGLCRCALFRVSIQNINKSDINKSSEYVLFVRI